MIETSLFWLHPTIQQPKNDACTIALLKSPHVNLEVTQTFEECVREFRYIQADVSTPAYFITRYTKKLHAYRKIRIEK